MKLEKDCVKAVRLAIGACKIADSAIRINNLCRLGDAVSTRLCTMLTDLEDFYIKVTTKANLMDRIDDIDVWTVDRDKYIFTTSLYLETLCVIRQGLIGVGMADSDRYNEYSNLCSIAKRTVGYGKRHMDEVEAYYRAIAACRDNISEEAYLQQVELPPHIEEEFKMSCETLANYVNNAREKSPDCDFEDILRRVGLI